jgi:hypothetical protein
MRLQSEGIEVEVPQGWDGEIYRRPADFTALGGSSEENKPVLHVANFALPAERGDFGSNAVEMMRAENVMVVLFEYGAGSAGKALFASEGIPTLQAADFAPHTLQRPLPGQSGVQRFFSFGDRAFCLYVVLGAHARRHELLPEVNQVLASIAL